MTNQQKNSGQPAVLRTAEMIGRQAHLDAVARAVADNPKCYVLFFPGKGGMGKTRLLQEIGQAVPQMQPQTGKQALWSGIIDLYHPETHSGSGIEQALIKQLDPGNEYFGAYREQRRHFEAQRRAGLSGQALETLRQALTAAFLAGYNRLAQVFRPLLTFDTLELVQFESDTIQDLCEVKSETLSVKNWFLEMVAQFPNTVTIFAGRPRHRLQAEFQQHFSRAGCTYDTIPIARFSQPEAKTYLQALAAKQPQVDKALEPDLFPQVYRAADNGRPIYLSLIADLLSPDLGTSLSEIFPAQTKTFSAAQRAQMKAEIARRLVALPEPLGDIVRYMAYARQGLTRPLLRTLTQGAWSEREMDAAFETLRRFTFVKTSPQDETRLYLHDEVYDLLNDHILVNREETDPIFRQLRDCYHTQRAALQQELEQIATLPEKQRAEKRETLVNQLEMVTVRQLYYELHVDPLPGYYRCYNRWTDAAIESRRFGYDMRLRDVLLGFLKSIAPPDDDDSTEKEASHPRRQWLAQRTPIDNIDRDGAVFWVRRYLARDESEPALRVAEKLRHSQNDLFCWETVDDALYKAALLVAWGEALIFSGKEPEKALATLQEVQDWIGDHDAFTIEERDEPWRRVRLLGRAEMDIGYLYRLQYKLSTAVTHYQNTIRFYRQVDVLSEMATAVNNLAYVFSLLGSLDEAEALANDAIDIWTRLGRRYNEALSRNTRALVALAADEPHRARAFCDQALSLLLESDVAGANRRAEGLVYLARGETYRRLANLQQLRVYNEQTAREFFVTSRNNLQNALDRLQEIDARETLDAYAELGRLYRDWMGLLRRMDEKQEARERRHQADYYFQKGLQTAREQEAKHHEADIFQDIGVLHHLSGQARQAQEAIRQAEARIPEQYKPQPDTGFTAVAQPVNPFWKILGKLYLLHAQLAFDAGAAEPSAVNGRTEEGLAHAVRAVAAFQQYNDPDTPNPKMKRTKALIYAQLKERKASHLRKLLDRARQVAAQYGLDDVDWLFRYLERTLGV